MEAQLASAVSVPDADPEPPATVDAAPARPELPPGEVVEADAAVAEALAAGGYDVPFPAPASDVAVTEPVATGALDVEIDVAEAAVTEPVGPLAEAESEWDEVAEAEEWDESSEEIDLDIDMEPAATDAIELDADVDVHFEAADDEAALPEIDVADNTPPAALAAESLLDEIDVELNDDDDVPDMALAAEPLGVSSARQRPDDAAATAGAPVTGEADLPHLDLGAGSGGPEDDADLEEIDLVPGDTADEEIDLPEADLAPEAEEVDLPPIDIALEEEPAAAAVAADAAALDALSPAPSAPAPAVAAAAPPNPSSPPGDAVASAAEAKKMDRKRFTTSSGKVIDLGEIDDLLADLE